MTSEQVRALAWLRANYAPFAGYAYAVQLRLVDLLVLAADMVKRAWRDHALELRAHAALVNYDLHREAYARACPYRCGLTNGRHGAGVACRCGCPRSHHTGEREIRPRTATARRFDDSGQVVQIVTGDMPYTVHLCSTCRYARWGEPTRYGDGVCAGYQTEEGAELCPVVRAMERSGTSQFKGFKVYQAPSRRA
jgi:hypothetical protein